MTEAQDAASEARDLHGWLRRETRTRHEALHALPAFADLAAGRLDAAGYAGLLGRLLGFWREVDGHCGEAARDPRIAGRGYVYRPRSGLLEADLAARGAAVPPPLPRLLDAPRGPAAAAGMLYVADGSILGSAVMSRAAARFAGAGSVAGAGYWSWCRDNAGALWPRTLALLPECAPDAAARHDMLEAALATFAAFGRRFEDDPTAAAAA